MIPWRSHELTHGCTVTSEKHKSSVHVQVCIAQVYFIKFFIALFPYRLKIQDIFKRFYIVLSFKKKYIQNNHQNL